MAARELGPRTPPRGVAATARRRRLGRTVVAGRVARPWASGVGRQDRCRRNPPLRRASGHRSASGMSLAAPTIVTHGSDELRSRHPASDDHRRGHVVPAVQRARRRLRPRRADDHDRVRDGDEWIVNGQKVWNTSAHHADYGMLLARTDWDVPKHQGITLLRPADAPAGRRGAPAAADEPPRVVQRGVPHRCSHPSRQSGGRPRRRLARRPHDPDARADLRHHAPAVIRGAA